MVNFNTIDNLDVKGKRVFVRADLNIPLMTTKDGLIKASDTMRVMRSAPTIKELLDKGASAIIVASHLGRPKGEAVPEMSLWPAVIPLSDALGGIPVAFCQSCIGEKAKSAVESLHEGGVLLLENLRFHKEEKDNDENFAKQLAELCDVYVDDAFSTSHRSHASIDALAHMRPNAAGRLMQKELEALGTVLQKPEKPVAAIIGGAKVSSKIDLLTNLVEKVDLLVIGGGMANTFLFAQGIDIGKSLCEKDMVETAKSIMAAAEKHNCEIVLPSNARVADRLEEGIESTIVPINEIPKDKMILDIGPTSAINIISKLTDCKTLIWNGPLGAFEFKPFDNSTNSVAQSAAALTRAGMITSVAGGGDTVAALRNAGSQEGFTYLSTAGGAFLEWLEGKTLPGVQALEK
ncbi:MAG: phosphoglycerate kinase [Alphaproteobacteria bacterium]|nr:phosphoglycerate kinase [Alphaproteobacteria bacterium]